MIIRSFLEITRKNILFCGPGLFVLEWQIGPLDSEVGVAAYRSLALLRKIRSDIRHD